jgi:DNA polymerase-1
MIGYNIDLSQAENRTVAYVAPDELMIRAFEDGLDVHSLTGSLISGLPYDQVKEEDGKGICCEIGGGIYTWRFWGKKANHGLNYDLGFRTFAFYYEIPEREAQYIVERYHRAYPGVRQYHSWVRNKLSQGRILENCLGRKRLFMDRWGDELFKEAYSFIPQSSIADKVNHHGLIPLYYNAEYDEVEILNQVHDSLVFQIPTTVPLERHVEILFSLRQSLEQPLVWDGREFVIPADIEFTLPGGNLGKKGKDSNPLGLQKLKGRTRKELLENLTVCLISKQGSNNVTN